MSKACAISFTWISQALDLNISINPPPPKSNEELFEGVPRLPS
jgi:hypothetical protein